MMKRRHDSWDIETIDITIQKPEEKADKANNALAAFFKRHWKKTIVMFGVTYLVVFLFGLFTVRYYYDENGNRRLYRLTFSDMQLQDDYDTLTEQLNSVRSILTDITIVDIHLANGEYDNYEAATLYTEILDEQLDVLIPKINSMNLQNEQEPIRENMESVLRYDLALYLQKITDGLKSGDSVTVKAALQYREKALRTYEILEASIKEIADKLKVSDSAYYSWDVFESAEKKDGSAVFKSGGED